MIHLFVFKVPCLRIYSRSGSYFMKFEEIRGKFRVECEFWVLFYAYSLFLSSPIPYTLEYLADLLETTGLSMMKLMITGEQSFVSGDVKMNF